jgi:hypothetical protein
LFFKLIASTFGLLLFQIGISAAAITILIKQEESELASINESERLVLVIVVGVFGAVCLVAGFVNGHLVAFHIWL